MINESTVKLTIALKDSDLDDEQLDQLTRNLRQEMEDLVGDASIGRSGDMPEGAKSLISVLLGVLNAEVSIENCLKLLRWLQERLGNKAIEIEVEANGKKLKVKASNKQELIAAVEQAQKFIEGK